MWSYDRDCLPVKAPVGLDRRPTSHQRRRAHQRDPANGTKGILPDHMIAELATSGGIRPAREFAPDQIQPASLDLRLGKVAYRVRASFLPGPQHHGRRAHRRTEAARDRADRRRGAGDQLRLHRAAARKPGAAGRHRGRRQSEKLDRPHRRVHPRDRRPAPAASTASTPAITARSTPRSARRPFRCWCARARGCRRSVSAAATRCSTPRRCARCTTSERLTDDADADVGDGIAVGVDLAGLGPERLRRLSRQAPHRPDRRREARRPRRSPISGSRSRRAPTRA